MKTMRGKVLVQRVPVSHQQRAIAVSKSQGLHFSECVCVSLIRAPSQGWVQMHNQVFSATSFSAVDSCDISVCVCVRVYLYEV